MDSMIVAFRPELFNSRNALKHSARRSSGALPRHPYGERIIELAAAAVLVVVTGACRDNSPAAPLRPHLEIATFARTPKLVELLPGRVIIRYRDGADVVSVAHRHRAQHDADLNLARTAVLDVEAGQEESIAAELAQDPDVEFAEADYLMTIAPCEVGNCQVTNDPFVSAKWDLNNTGVIRAPDGTVVATGRAHADIKWADAVDALGTDFGGSAVVGVIDTGIRGTHVDLAGRVVAARNFAVGYPDTLIADRDGHGTHVAGIAAARGNDGVGISGVAYGAKIKLINAKACDLYIVSSSGAVGTLCPSSSVANAIVWAVDNGANVLNVSLGATVPSSLQQAALQYARAHNVLPFCAVGNGSAPAVDYPARFPECVAVAATNWSDEHASYSNSGPEVALSAPGGDAGPFAPYSFILSSWGTGDKTYAFAAGTSMAAPEAAGLAALLYASGYADADKVLARLEETADDLGAPGRDPVFGYGRINAYRALTGKDQSAPPVAIIDPSYVGVEGWPVAFSSAGSFDPNNHPITYSWDFGDGLTSSEANPTHVYADNGSYAVKLTVTDESGRVTAATSTAGIANAPPTVAGELSVSRILSGQTVHFRGKFSDGGVLDMPWAWAIGWADGASSTDSAMEQSLAIEADHRFCAARPYSVSFGVADKDGGLGTTQQPLLVLRNPVSIAVRTPVNVRGVGNGLLTVDVLSTPSFDARGIDPTTATVSLGQGSQIAVLVQNGGVFFSSAEDTNNDGLPDLVLRFRRSDVVAGASVSSATAGLTLLATMNDGCVQVQGSTSVRVVP